MKLVKAFAAMVLVTLVVLVFITPVGPLPGFIIGGTPTPAPATWPDTSQTHEIKLKVSGLLPRVVIIWVVEYSNELYIVGAADGGWTAMIGAGAPVEMRLGDNTYALQATRVNSGWKDIATAYVDKYRPDYPDIVAGFGDVEAAAGQMAIFRLDRS